MQRRGQRLEGRRRGEKGTGGGAPRRAKTSGVCWGVEGLAFQQEGTGKGMQKGGGGSCWAEAANEPPSLCGTAPRGTEGMVIRLMISGICIYISDRDHLCHQIHWSPCILPSWQQQSLFQHSPL